MFEQKIDKIYVAVAMQRYLNFKIHTNRSS